MQLRHLSRFFDPFNLNLFKRKTKIENAFFDALQQNDLSQMKLLLRQYPFLLEAVKAEWAGDEMCAAIVVHDINRVHNLLEAGYNCNVNIEERPQYREYSLLYLAVDYKAYDIVTLLLESSADPNVANEAGCTPLHLAARDNAIMLADVLLRYGANVNAQDSCGDTPLHWAAEAGYIAFSNFLIEKGADFTVRAHDGCTPNDWLQLPPQLDETTVDTDRRWSFSSASTLTS